MQHQAKSNPKNEIRVLSYNVCWGCMLGSKKGCSTPQQKHWPKNALEPRRLWAPAGSHASEQLLTILTMPHLATHWTL